VHARPLLTASVHLADFLFTYVDRICHLSHLKSPDDFALLSLVFLQRMLRRSLRWRDG